MFLKRGATVTINCPWDGRDGDGDTWLRGTIEETVAACAATGFAVHVVRVTAFKWARADTWGPYDGVPCVLAREGPDEWQGRESVLQWVDTWPRRRL